ncbi:hypothetical protein B0J17DRAFT_634208 [Rhizoctonia solani]|nr:hypothetical protein B0J17DRAFT_634208 [Rhizoctonia solani]
MSDQRVSICAKNSRFAAHTSSLSLSNSSSSIRGRKHKAGEINAYPEKFARTSTQSEPSLHARRKAAEERAANLVRIIYAAASLPETMTNADIVRPTPRSPLKCLAYALCYHTNVLAWISPELISKPEHNIDNIIYSEKRRITANKLTCTRERNRISAELMEALQVLKHSVRQHRSPDLNPCLLDFTERIAPVGDDVVE